MLKILRKQSVVIYFSFVQVRSAPSVSYGSQQDTSKNSPHCFRLLSKPSNIGLLTSEQMILTWEHLEGFQLGNVPMFKIRKSTTTYKYVVYIGYWRYQSQVRKMVFCAYLCLGAFLGLFFWVFYTALCPFLPKFLSKYSLRWKQSSHWICNAMFWKFWRNMEYQYRKSWVGN